MPVVDSSNCVECNWCMFVCPILGVCKFHTPEKVFATRSLDSFTETIARQAVLHQNRETGWGVS